MHFSYFSSGLESIFLAGKHYKGQMRSNHFSDFLFLFLVTFPISLNFLKQIMLGENLLLSQGHQVNQNKGEKLTNIYLLLLVVESLNLGQIAVLGVKRGGRASEDIGLDVLC